MAVYGTQAFHAPNDVVIVDMLLRSAVFEIDVLCRSPYIPSPENHLPSKVTPL